MTSAPQMDSHYVVKQPQTAEEVQQVHWTTPKNTEGVPPANSDIDMICQSLLGCLCCCCCLCANDSNSDCICCNCDC